MIRRRSREAGFTVIELMVVLAVFVPVVLAVAGLATRHYQHNVAQTQHADTRTREGRVLQHELRNARDVEYRDGSLLISSASASTEWRLRGTDLQRRGKERERLRGVRDLRLRTSGALVRVEIDFTAKPPIVYAFYMRGAQ